MQGAIYNLTRQLTKVDALYIDLSKIKSAHLFVRYTVFYGKSLTYRLFSTEIKIFPYIIKKADYLEFTKTDMSFLDLLYSLQNKQYFEVQFELYIVGEKKYLLELREYLKTKYAERISWDPHTVAPNCDPGDIRLHIKSKNISVPIKNLF